MHELIAARTFLGSNLNEIDIIDRYEKAGGIPRHIFLDEQKFSDILKSQMSAINYLSADQIRKLTSNDRDSAHTFSKGQPKSLLMVYESSSSFRGFNIAVSSKLVLAKLFKKTQCLCGTL